MQVFANGRFGFKNIAATAMYVNKFVFWMYTRFHGSALPSNISWKQTANATEKTRYPQEKNNFFYQIELVYRFIDPKMPSEP